jgi:hypothetical protein
MGLQVPGEILRSFSVTEDPQEWFFYKIDEINPNILLEEENLGIPRNFQEMVVRHEL